MHNTSSQTAMLMALSFLRGVGPAALRRAAKVPLGADLNIDHVAREVPAIGKALADPGAWTAALEAASVQLDQADRFHARILSPLDIEYPALLAATKDDPFLLYVRGNLASDPNKSVAIIGTREPTIHGQQTAFRITKFCVEQGFSVVSGLAIGCDGIAHQTAIEAGGHTVAVLAHGLQMVAPSRHRMLAEEILSSGGALVSQFAFGQKVLPQQYVIRDRVQAGMSKLVVMIQSDIKGGSMHAARASLEYGRALVVPYPTDADVEKNEPKIQANLLIANGAASEKALLLRCPPASLDQVVVVRSRTDYTHLVASMRLDGFVDERSQGALI